MHSIYMYETDRYTTDAFHMHFTHNCSTINMQLTSNYQTMLIIHPRLKIVYISYSNTCIPTAYIQCLDPHIQFLYTHTIYIQTDPPHCTHPAQGPTESPAQHPPLTAPPPVHHSHKPAFPSRPRCRARPQTDRQAAPRGAPLGGRLARPIYMGVWLDFPVFLPIDREQPSNCNIPTKCTKLTP